MAVRQLQGQLGKASEHSSRNALVLPAASKPSMRILISLFPNILPVRPKKLPDQSILITGKSLTRT